MLKASLEYTTTVWMGREVINTPAKRLRESQAFGGYAFNKPLDNMISIRVLHTFNHMRSQFFDKCGLLLRSNATNCLKSDRLSVVYK
jgi:hypothetical protein